VIDERLRLRCIEAVVEEGERFGVLAQELDDAGRLDVRVPWVPAWSARDLVGHLGVVYRWATAVVTAGHDRTPPHEETPPSGGLLDWYADGLTGLVRALRETPPDAPAWHMSPAAERVAGSWARRQATVTVVSEGTGRAWTVAIDRGAVTVSRLAGDGVDATLHGDPAELLLHLWGRPADVVVDGDPAAEALLRGR
jgi:Mycothiol maleylpyruvate isomerase N-terminal domain